MIDPSAKISALKVQGDASADWGNDRDLILDNPGNLDLGMKRAQAEADELTDELGRNGIGVASAQISAAEHNLTKAQYDEVLAAAKDAGFKTASEAVRASDHGRTLTGKIKNLVETYVTKKRGTTVIVEISRDDIKLGPEKEVIVPGPKPPEHPHRDFKDFNFQAWPLLLLAGLIPQKFGLAKRLVPKTRKETVEFEFGDPVWFKLYKEGVVDFKTKDGEPAEAGLTKDAVFWTRKYQDLLRDDRIKEVDRMDYYDMDGADKSMRVIYVDHTPTDDTREAFRQILQRTANANLG